MSSSNVTDTLSQRGNNYGSFFDNATVTQALKDISRQCPGWEQMKPDQREAFDLIFLKMGRALTGNPDYIDNFHDIQGYAKLVEDRLLAEQREKSQYPTSSGELG